MTERKDRVNLSFDDFITGELRDIGRRSVNPGLIDRILLKGDALVYTKLATQSGMTREQIEAAIQQGQRSAQSPS